MKKYVLLVFTGLMFACHSSNSTDENNEQKENIVLTKEEKIIKLYHESVLPIFKNYQEAGIPSEFTIDKKDLGIDGGAAEGYLVVSQGLVNLSKKNIQLFALSHEVGHIVTIKQARLFGLIGDISSGNMTNDYKKAEYFADLIAIHLIKTKLPESFILLAEDFPYLQNLLGTADSMHPSGKDRIASMNTYIQNSKENGDEEAFKNRFIAIWKMD